MADSMDVVSLGIINPLTLSATLPLAAVDAVQESSFNFADFSTLLDNIEAYFLKDAEALLQLKEKYGHEPFLDQIRNGMLADEQAFIESDYLPTIQYLPYLTDDLLAVVQRTQQILDVLKDFPIDAGQGIYKNYILGQESEESKIFYRARNLIDSLFYPHLALLSRHKQIPVLAEFVQLVEQAKQIWSVSVSLKTPTEAEATRASIVSFLATASEKAAQFLATLPQKIVQVAKNSVQEAAPGIGDVLAWLFRQWWTWALIGVGVGLPVLIKKISLKRNPPELETTPQENPPLLLINPPPKNYDQLWKRAQSLERGLNESDFKKALSLFYAQHERYPDVSALERRNGPPGIPIGVLVGKVKDVTYKPPKGRKTPYDYKHKMDNTQLASDPTGKHLFFIGDTYMDRDDGWLKR